jgi:hypothetical protein
MNKATLIRLIVALAILTVLGAGLVIVTTSPGDPNGSVPAGFVH